MLIKPLDHFKEVRARPAFVTENEGSKTGLKQAAVKELGAKIGRNAELPRLQDDRADLPGLCLLFLDLVVKFELRPIEDERFKGTGLWA
jgi:hypothetical protein